MDDEQEQSVLSGTLDWLQVGLGALFVALVITVSVQWWARSQPGRLYDRLSMELFGRGLRLEE